MQWCNISISNIFTAAVFRDILATLGILWQLSHTIQYIVYILPMITRDHHENIMVGAYRIAQINFKHDNYF